MIGVPFVMAGRGASLARRGGRGAYYKNLYGRGGRERGGNHKPSLSLNVSDHTSDDSLSRGPAEIGRIIGSKEILERELHRIDGKPYGAYKDLKGIFLSFCSGN